LGGPTSGGQTESEGAMVYGLDIHKRFIQVGAVDGEGHTRREYRLEATPQRAGSAARTFWGYGPNAVVLVNLRSRISSSSSRSSHRKR
jgi:hypothetical protein